MKQIISKIEEAKKLLKEEREKELTQAQKELEAWATKYQVNIDVEMLYSPEKGFQKRFIIIDIKK